MANNLDSNFTRQLAKVFLPAFDNARVLSKNVDTQLLQGRFNPDSGDNVDFKRPTDYVTKRTSNGDISATTATSIITGKATGTVQDYFTEEVDFYEADEAIKMGQLDELLKPIATRLVTDMELDFAKYCTENAGLLAGSYGTAVTTWSDVAAAGAVMRSAGIPMDEDWCYFVNPYTQVSLASDQRSLGAGGVAGKNIDNANSMATIAERFAGMRVMTADSLHSLTTHSGADRAGALAANPDVTYVTHKDSMEQSLSVSGFQANLQVRAGEVIQITGRNRLNMSTRKPVVNASGANVAFTAVVSEAVTLSGTGTGTIKIKGPAIYEATGAYNTVDSAPISGDVVTLLGSASTLYQPNMFWHKKAFSIGFVPMKKLDAQDTVMTTKDGINIRISRGSSIRENKQIVRFDLRPAYATLNPFFAGQGWG